MTVRSPELDTFAFRFFVGAYAATLVNLSILATAKEETFLKAFGMYRNQRTLGIIAKLVLRSDLKDLTRIEKEIEKVRQTLFSIFYAGTFYFFGIHRINNRCRFWHPAICHELSDNLRYSLHRCTLAIMKKRKEEFN